MKQKIGLPAIIGAVVLLIGLVFTLYKFTLAPPAIDPKAAEEHKDMGEFYRSQGRPGGASGAPKP